MFEKICLMCLWGVQSEPPTEPTVFNHSTVLKHFLHCFTYFWPLQGWPPPSSLCPCVWLGLTGRRGGEVMGRRARELSLAREGCRWNSASTCPKQKEELWGMCREDELRACDGKLHSNMQGTQRVSTTCWIPTWTWRKAVEALLHISRWSCTVFIR